jgi:hypothetical protein
LAEIGYDGYFNFELQPSKIPAAARDDFDRYCASLGRALIAMYENARDAQKA